MKQETWWSGSSPALETKYCILMWEKLKRVFWEDVLVCACMLAFAYISVSNHHWNSTHNRSEPMIHHHLCVFPSNEKNASSKNSSSLQFPLTYIAGRDQIVVHVRRPEDTPLNSHRRLIWCPFILDDNEENQDDTSQTLALLHEDRVTVFYLDSIWPSWKEISQQMHIKENRNYSIASVLCSFPLSGRGVGLGSLASQPQ